MKRFEDIEVYQKAIDFTIDIFKLTENSSINYNIKNQLERAALSIPNNIAEGFELQSNKQFIKFLYISKDSCGECRSLLTVCHIMNIIDDENFKTLNGKAIEISKQLSNFIKYLKNSTIK